MITAIVRTAILYALLILGLRLTGKRQIGQLEPIELVLTLLISDLASVPMQDFGIPLLNGVIPIAVLLALSTLLSCASLRSVRFHELLCGRPAVVIRGGRLRQDTVRRNRLTPDEILEALRAQGVSDIGAVKYAVLETNGQLSVLLYTAQQALTPAQLSLPVRDEAYLPAVLISDGRLLQRNVRRAGRDDGWVRRTLEENGLPGPEAVYLLALNDDGTVLLIPREASS